MQQHCSYSAVWGSVIGGLVYCSGKTTFVTGLTTPYPTTHTIATNSAGFGFGGKVVPCMLEKEESSAATHSYISTIRTRRHSTRCRSGPYWPILLLIGSCHTTSHRQRWQVSRHYYVCCSEYKLSRSDPIKGEKSVWLTHAIGQKTALYNVGLLNNFVYIVFFETQLRKIIMIQIYYLKMTKGI